MSDTFPAPGRRRIIALEILRDEAIRQLAEPSIERMEVMRKAWGELQAVDDEARRVGTERASPD